MSNTKCIWSRGISFHRHRLLKSLFFVAFCRRSLGRKQIWHIFRLTERLWWNDSVASNKQCLAFFCFPLMWFSVTELGHYRTCPNIGGALVIDALGDTVRYGGMFNIHLIANFPQIAPAKEFWKSINIWRRYGQNSVECLSTHALYSQLHSLKRQQEIILELTANVQMLILHCLFVNFFLKLCSLFLFYWFLL